MGNTIWKYCSLILTVKLASCLQNVVVLRGNTSELNCKTAERGNVEWYFRGVGLIPKYDKRIRSTRLPGGGSSTDDSLLFIHQVDLSHAGTYICHVISPGKNDDAVRTRIFYSQLVVIGSVECNIGSRSLNPLDVMEETTVSLMCKILFRGNWHPFIEWSELNKYNSSRRINATEEESNNKSNITITSRLIFVADRSLHDSRFLCTIRFERKPDTVLSNFSNIPAYSYVWTTETINVLYISPKISIIPAQNIYHPGDNVSCEMDANPSPVYQWKNLQTGVVSSGSHVVLEVPKDHIPVYTYVCTVRYAVVKFNISRTFERTIIVTNKTTDSNHSMIIVSVLMSILVLITLFGCIHRLTINGKTKKASVLDLNSSDPYEEIDSKYENDDMKLRELPEEPYYENSEMFPVGDNNCVVEISNSDEDANESSTSTSIHRDSFQNPNVTVSDIEDDNYTSNIEMNMTPKKPALYSKLLTNRSK